MKRVWTSSYHASLIGKAIAAVRADLAGDVTLESVARLVGVSQAHFSRVFKEQKGVCFSDFVRMEKRRSAKRLLHDFSLSIKEVAARSGYLNPDHFSRDFKDAAGMTASEYRNSIKSKYKSM